MPKPVILIGGPSGCGKSTLANRLLCELELDHRIGTGFVRAIVQAETTPERDPGLFAFTFDSDDPVAHIRWQAERLLPAVRRCIDRARREGTSIVIEGSHLLPDLYAPLADVYLCLDMPDSEVEHRRRVLGDTHTGRKVADKQFAGIRATGEHYRQQARRLGIEPRVFGDNLPDFVAMVRAAGAD